MKPLVFTVLLLGVMCVVCADQPDAPAAPDPGDDRYRPMREPPPRGRFDRPLNEQEVRQALQIMQQIDPEMAEHLTAAYDAHPERVAHKLRERFPHLRRFMHMQQRDGQMFELRVQQLRLVRRAERLRGRYWAAVEAGNEQNMDKAEAELTAVLNEQFELRLRVWEREVERLEMRLEEMREQLQQHAEDRDELIAAQLDDLLASRPPLRQPWLEHPAPPHDRPDKRGEQDDPRP